MAEYEEQGTPAEVVNVIKRTGTSGEVTQVLCKILDGPEKGRVKRRNVKGKVKKGDVLVLVNTQKEAKDIGARWFQWNVVFVIKKSLKEQVSFM